MRDDLLDNMLYRVRDRHGPDGTLARTMRNISALAAQAREIHKEKGPQAAQAVIRGELIPKYLHHIGEVQKAINTASDTRVRDGWAIGYGLALTYRNTLTSLGRLSSGDWSVAQMDAKKGAAA
ncbi:hypothetical protein MKK69_19465 [Methylobacterium sp. J-026]|uniref:hypothetical protein n=1 Tax=Methylobacterium sp. J-026 TaxID=2836624 RepID=UPI001FBAD770|nr:hypothetical protein [Methylobacterium sp. J-026]MCJ2136203.1 hypothetical protein [Methylobacterium sp. J-026]